MAYRQYTQCCSVTDHVGGVAAQAIIAAAIGASTTLIFGAGLGPAALIAGLTAIIAYCRWWLYDRLICLGGDKCAIGWVLTVEPPDEKSGFDAIDTDYSINLVLPGHTVGATQHEVATDGGLGILVKETSDVAAANLGFTGNL